jgi:hypothetical protein
MNARTGLLCDVPTTDTAHEHDDMHAGHALRDMTNYSDYASVPPARSNCDTSTNDFGHDCIALCKALGLVIANGRCLGDTNGALTYVPAHSASGAGPATPGSSVDLVLISACVFTSIQSLTICPQREPSLCMATKPFAWRRCLRACSRDQRTSHACLQSCGGHVPLWPPSETAAIE